MNLRNRGRSETRKYKWSGFVLRRNSHMFIPSTASSQGRGHPAHRRCNRNSRGRGSEFRSLRHFVHAFLVDLTAANGFHSISVLRVYSVHTLCVLREYFVRTPCVLRTYSVRTPCVLRVYSVRTPCVLRAYSVRTPCVLRADSMQTPCVLRADSVQTPGVLRADSVRTPCRLCAYSAHTPCRHRLRNRLVIHGVCTESLRSLHGV